MEALILIFGELIFAALAPFVALVVEVLGAIVSGIIAAVSGKRAENSAVPRVAKILVKVFATLTAIGFMAVLIVNFFFFDGAVRFVLEKLEDRAQIVTECGTIDGSLLSGRIDLRDCNIRRTSHVNSTFDLTLVEASMNLRMSSLLGTATLDHARVIGLQGWVRLDRSQSQTDGDDGKDKKPRRNFAIRDLLIADSQVELSGINTDGNAFNVPLVLERVESKPLRSRLALFDIMFRSNASGTIADAPFRLASSEISGGRRTEWRAENVPIASFGAMTGGTLAWFSSGTVDIYVDDEWQRSESTDIDMDWRLQFSDLEVTPPAGTGRVAQFITKPLTGYVNSFDGEFPLEFEMLLNENQFEYKSSLAAAGLWNALGDATNKALSVIGVDLSSPESTGERLKDGAKSILDRVRRPKEDDSETAQ